MYTLGKALGIVEQGDKKKIYVSHITVRQSISILIFKLVLIDILAAIFFLTSYSLLFNQGIIQNFTAILLVVSIFKIALTAYLVLEWVNEYYEITPTLIYYKRGIIFRRIKKHDLALIRSVRVKHGLIGRIFNFGTLSLMDIRLNVDINLFMIHNPLKYLKILEDLIPDLEEERKFFREKKLEDKQD